MCYYPLEHDDAGSVGALCTHDDRWTKSGWVREVCRRECRTDCEEGGVIGGGRAHKLAPRGDMMDGSNIFLLLLQYDMTPMRHADLILCRLRTFSRGAHKLRVLAMEQHSTWNVYVN